MSEERRLCYVGFTRARRRLFCSCAQARALFGELRFNAPSRFLSEVPRELFGFDDNTTVTMDPVHARPPTVRRRYEDDDTGPMVDHSYDQSGEFGDDGDGDVRGRKVVHSQFGRGVILDVNGKGPTAKLTVRFDSVGVKLVIARFLQPL
jgi:DNA helicase-2/ATP-dependent DNA helicase PcrA